MSGAPSGGWEGPQWRARGEPGPWGSRNNAATAPGRWDHRGRGGASGLLRPPGGGEGGIGNTRGRPGPPSRPPHGRGSLERCCRPAAEGPGGGPVASLRGGTRGTGAIAEDQHTPFEPSNAGWRGLGEAEGGEGGADTETRDPVERLGAANRPQSQVDRNIRRGSEDDTRPGIHRCAAERRQRYRKYTGRGGRDIRGDDGHPIAM